MRNLIDIVENMNEANSFFHVTATENVSSILANGLIPQTGDRSQKLDDHGIYLFSSLEDAENALANWLGNEFDEDEPLSLLRVVLPTDAAVTQEAFEFVCHTVIPAQNITDLGDADDYLGGLTESVLNERALQVEVPHGSMTRQIPVHRNPTATNLIGMLNSSRYGNMRGLINGDDIYWWDSDDALHAHVADAMGFDPLSNDHEEEDARRLVLAKQQSGTPFLSINPQHSHHPRLTRLVSRVES